MGFLSRLSLTKWLLEGLIDKVTRFQQSKLGILLITFRTLERTALTATVGGTIWVYIYGMMYVLPFVSGESTIIHFLGFLLGTWCLFGVLSNLYLLRRRNSSIRHRFLGQPVIPPSPNFGSGGDSGAQFVFPECHTNDPLTIDQKNGEQIKYLGQQFLDTPLDPEKTWRFCALCEVYVPPRAWHCTTCKTCILRRDHHCVFAMSCIGEDNHIHFLGFLAYFSFGATCATMGGMYYMYYNFGISPVMYVIKSFCSTYIVLFDFSFANILASLVLMAGGNAAAFCFYYLTLACRNQTSADKFRGIERPVSSGKRYSYANLKKFLGPNPVMRIIWPLSSVLKHDYHQPQEVEEAP